MPLSLMRHVTILALSTFCAAAVTAADTVNLFDGTTLTGWEGAPGLWSVQDGVITGETSADAPLKANSFLIWRGGTVSDFVIEFDYVIQSDYANSGLQYRSVDKGNFVVAGYQADIESGAKHSGINYGEKTGRGIMAARGERVWLAGLVDGKEKKSKTEKFADGAALQANIKGKGEWNHYKITAKGRTMTHEINGVLMSETIDESEKDFVPTGIIGFQLHVGKPMKIQFKNITLTPTE